MIKEPRSESLNATWRRYRCIDCGNKYEALTVDPLPKDKRICALCYKRRHNFNKTPVAIISKDTRF